MKDFDIMSKCDLCEGTSYTIFLEAKDRNYQTGKFTFLKCSRCGLVWLSPRPNAKILGKYYPQEYLAYKTPKPPSKIQNIVRSVIYHFPFNKIFIKDRLFFHLPKGNLLDVGTGNGAYLDVLKSWGYSVWGVEINIKSVEDCLKRGLKVKQGDLHSGKFRNNLFDVVRFSHVLEHVPSPMKDLKETHRILKPAGLVVIMIPNIESLFFRIFQSYWYPLEAPRHFTHFSPQTISQYLKKSGYKAIEINFEQSPYTLIRSIMFRLDRKNVEKRFGLIVYPLALLLRVLNFLGWSDAMVVYARKS